MKQWLSWGVGVWRPYSLIQVANAMMPKLLRGGSEDSISDINNIHEDSDPSTHDAPPPPAKETPTHPTWVSLLRPSALRAPAPATGAGPRPFHVHQPQGRPAEPSAAPSSNARCCLPGTGNTGVFPQDLWACPPWIRSYRDLEERRKRHGGS